MHYEYGQNVITSILENIQDTKYVRLHDCIYEFYIKKSNLMLNIYDVNNNSLNKTYTIEKNVKSDFNICGDERGDIHIIAISKKYELLYIHFSKDSWIRERIYNFDRELGVPSIPIVKAWNNLICLIVSFIKISDEKMWCLGSYIGGKGVWRFKVIDEAPGLCYNQPSASIDKLGNIHLIYRYLNEFSNLKYVFFDRAVREWRSPIFILDNGVNKYRPYIFANKLNKIFICWIEIADNKIFLCYTSLYKEDYCKIDITEELYDMSILSNAEHIFNVSCLRGKCYYDLCCNRYINSELRFKTAELCKGGLSVDTGVRLFLDIKRELENQINELKNNTYVKSENYNLEKENQRMKEEIEQKDRKINELYSTLNKFLNENNELRLNLKKMQKILEERNIRSQANLDLDKKTRLRFVKKFLGFIRRKYSIDLF